MVSWKMIRNLAASCLAFIGMLYLTGCTNKDNLTGNNWSGVTVQTIVDSTCFSDDCATGNGGFSFPAEGKIGGAQSPGTVREQAQPGMACGQHRAGPG